MPNTDFAPLLALLVAIAPANWTGMRAKYAYDDVRAMAGIWTYAATQDQPGWKEVGHTDFALMDFFDAYRAAHRDSRKPWTTVTVTFTRGKPEPEVELGYAPPEVHKR